MACQNKYLSSKSLFKEWGSVRVEKSFALFFNWLAIVLAFVFVNRGAMRLVSNYFSEISVAFHLVYELNEPCFL